MILVRLWETEIEVIERSERIKMQIILYRCACVATVWFTSPIIHDQCVYKAHCTHTWHQQCSSLFLYIPQVTVNNPVIESLRALTAGSEAVFWMHNFQSSYSDCLKDRAHLSTFKIFIFEKFSCFIVLVVFLVIVQSSELVSVWFCEKMTFFPNFFSYHIFAIFVGGASLGLPTACRLIAVSGARVPSVDGLVVRYIKMHHHVKSAITICLQFI